MNRHLVSVEVGVEGTTYEWVYLNRITFNKYWSECLDTLTVKRWRSVEEHMSVTNHIFENRPHLWHTVFNETTCTADVVREFLTKKLRNHKWSEELKCHVLW
jgi:hypothetical protein